MYETTQQGSTGNVIAALCSFFAPGLGQLLQGRVITALVHFVLAVAIWLVSFGTMGWIMHLWSTISAARWRGTA
jgi:TM2 domain-containing membrane protein YozV